MTYLNEQIDYENSIKQNKQYFTPFIYPPRCYCGEATLENIEFNISMQKLSEEIAYIAGLEAAGQITSKQAYKKVKVLTQSFLKTFSEKSVSCQWLVVSG